MPEIVFGDFSYDMSDTVLKELYEMAKKSVKSGLEEGADLCADGRYINSVGKKCTGSSCQVKISDCGLTPSIGSFHTHPDMADGQPSWGDLYCLVWGNVYRGKPGLGCQAGTTASGHISSMQCDHIKIPYNDEEARRISVLHEQWKRAWGHDFPDVKERFYPPVFIEFPQEKELTITKKCQLISSEVNAIVDGMKSDWYKKMPKEELCQHLGSAENFALIKRREAKHLWFATEPFSNEEQPCSKAVKDCDMAVEKLSEKHEELCYG